MRAVYEPYKAIGPSLNGESPLDQSVEWEVVFMVPGSFLARGF